MELRAGVRLDRYTLVAPLGEGGQAVVWKAIDPLEGGAVRALKVFQMKGASRENAERAQREADAVVGSQHPGILPCRTYFKDPAAELVVLVFDYVRGRSLADALVDPRMTPEHRRLAVRQLADTLAYVHGRGVIHRDIKPDNVLVSEAFWLSPAEAGSLKLVDFGIAAPAGNPHPLTREGGVVGTAPYLPPDLADNSGLFEAGNDFRRDVFAFGVLAWEVLIGGHPTGLPLGSSRNAFAGAYLAARAGKRVWPPAAPPSPELSLVQACLALSASGRPESCMAVADAFRSGGLDGARPRTSEPISLAQRPSRSSGTDLHVPPPRTEPASPLWAASGPASPHDAATPPTWSASGPASPHSTAPPFGGGAYRPVVNPAPLRARRPTQTPWALLLGAGLVTTVAVVTAVYFATRPSAPEGQQPLSGPNEPAIAAPSRDPSRDSPPPARPVVACCTDDSRTCRSGRACEPAPCPTLEDRPWRLRVGGGFLRNGGALVHIHNTWTSSFICVKNTRTGEDQCASSNEVRTRGSDATHRVLATTSDLIAGNFEVRVIDGGTERIRERAFGSPTGYKATALCTNVTLRLRNYTPDEGQIAVFLDDP